MKIDKNNNKKYKIKAICDNEIHRKESDSSYLFDLYYLFL